MLTENQECLEKMCSTPFGITEVGAPWVTTGPAPIAPCSTPFGITEVGA